MEGVTYRRLATRRARADWRRSVAERKVVFPIVTLTLISTATAAFVTDWTSAFTPVLVAIVATAFQVACLGVWELVRTPARLDAELREHARQEAERHRLEEQRSRDAIERLELELDSGHRDIERLREHLRVGQHLYEAGPNGHLIGALFGTDFRKWTTDVTTFLRQAYPEHVGPFGRRYVSVSAYEPDRSPRLVSPRRDDLPQLLEHLSDVIETLSAAPIWSRAS